MKRLVWILTAAAACAPTGKWPDTGAGGDSGTDTTTSGGTVTGEGTFCEVRSIFQASCVAGCHSAAAAQGGLDLQTDAYGALVGVASASYDGRTLVVAGDSAASFLVDKLAGTQAATEGTIMPPGTSLPPAQIETVRRWIDAGASDVCTSDTTGTGRYHPVGFDAPEEHGIAAKFQEDDCLGCHGEDLTGGSAGVSCDSCHESGWRTDCTYCHGGVDDTTGAPPEDIDDEADAAATTFPEHTAHVTETIHGAYDCVQCHSKPDQALSPGHFLVADDTPGVAELDFSAGLSGSAHYQGAASCSNLYCHGNGQGNNGTAHSGTDYSDCDSCHADASTRSRWDEMSGRHEKHLEEGIGCSECHDDVSSSEAITDPARHVDGNVDVALPSGMTRDSRGCSGTCHREEHERESW